ncbi:Shufflon-specific DNA recombinase [Sulfitobacter noctilucae]|uniref:tyrosine-type recombinase/integrase n=1 Tax=Sulfitobacter noctilucae TaxID=1342302 RepID=UPI000469C74F|nr:tyrosine-type recombinase/integrase [Sulfitobacter noctilucae]KIN60680.1 Shufflon-specific DNA recombinase [Sulfitobacter noctilucae]
MPIKKRSPYIPRNERLHLSGKLIEAMAAGQTDYLVKDDVIRRLHLKVTPAGNKTFLIRYRNTDGVERKLKLGTFPDMNVSVARKRAGEELLKVQLGDDPSASKAQRRLEPTFSAYADGFLVDYAEVQLRPITVRDYRGLLRGVINPAIGGKKLLGISQADLRQLQKVHSATPYRSNRAIGLVRRIYNYAQAAGDVPKGANPADGIRQFREEGKERLFSNDEMMRIGAAISELRVKNPSAIYAYSVIQFLFLTGCRKSEALRLQWSDIDFERGFLRFARTKTDPRTQALTDELTGLLQSLPSQQFSAWVFPGPDASKHLVNIAKSWSAVLRSADVGHARLHDIRHTVLSDIANQTDLPTAAAIGGHRSIQSTMRYVHGRAESTNRALRNAAAQKGRLLITTSSTKGEEE